jgi:hypothetical protein
MIEDKMLTRRERRKQMDKKKRRARRRRRARVRRVRYWRSVRTIRFWGRVASFIGFLLAIGFWAKFAFVYNIPTYAASSGPLENTVAYVTVKPWWFGPPVFDLSQYANRDPVQLNIANDPYAYLLLQLGKYSSVVEYPEIVWSKHG